MNSAKGTWSEWEEDELRRLFMENQASPATNQGRYHCVIIRLSTSLRCIINCNLFMFLKYIFITFY